MRSFDRWTYHRFALAVGNKAWKHAAIGIDLSTGKVEPMHAESDLFFIGLAADTVDATSVEKQLNVNLGTEIEVEYFASAGGIALTDIGKLAYFTDDNTVSLAVAGSLAGRIWDYQSGLGVGVEKLQGGAAGGGGASPVVTAPAFAAGDMVVLADPASGTIFDVPFTAANSTITLPAATADGTQIIFVADGTKNGHTVQYRDATGPVNLTTALTALKRHQVSLISMGGKWTANAYVSP